MRIADDHPGLFFFMLGIVVIVMTAVGLSLIIDRRFEFSANAGALRDEILSEKATFDQLMTLKNEGAGRLADALSTRPSAAAALKTLHLQQEVLAQREQSLRKSAADHEVAIRALEQEFQKFREQRRQAVRAAAKGEALRNLRVTGGKLYRNAVIVRVTDAGLEIRHEDGIARILAPDLERKWQDRFEWDDERRKALLAMETEQLASTAVAPPGVAVDRPREDEQASLRALRSEVIQWRLKESALSLEQSEAASRALYGGQTSVPGSLETWSAKSSRLSKELVRVRAEFSRAKAKLAVVAPGDPLLRTRERDDERF